MNRGELVITKIIKLNRLLKLAYDPLGYLLELLRKCSITRRCFSF